MANIAADAIRAYVGRDWGAVRDAKRRYWAQQLDSGGFLEALEVTEQLRSWMMQVDASWPTEAQREEDLATHRRVAAALAKTSRARASTARTRARRSR